MKVEISGSEATVGYRLDIDGVVGTAIPACFRISDPAGELAAPRAGLKHAAALLRLEQIVERRL
jgi:hypothetical protein